MSETETGPGPMPVTFGILGPLTAAREGIGLDLGGPRQRAVLALLLLQPATVVSLEQLIEGVWGDDPPRAAVPTVQTYVFHLRRLLEPDRRPGHAAQLLTTAQPGYCLAVKSERTDSGRFQAALEAARTARAAGSLGEASRLLGGALALWRGPVLADLASYAFVQPEAVRLQNLQLAAVEAKLEVDLAQGLYDGVAAECDAWIAREPLRERLREIVMLSLYRGGRQAEALAAYRRARDVLADELGVDPGPGLQRLHRAILEHDPALEPEEKTGRTVPVAHMSDSQGEARPGFLAAGIENGEVRPPEPVVGVQVDPLRRASRPKWKFSRPRRVLSSVSALLAVVAVGVIAVPHSPAPAARPLAIASNSVAVIDAASGRLLRNVAVGADPTAIAAGAGAIWVANGQDATVSRIDPTTLAVTQTINVGADPRAIAVGAGQVWVANSGGRTVSRIDPATNQVAQTIAVGNGPVAIAATAAAVWVAHRFDDTVWRLDPQTGRTVTRIAVGDAPSALAVVDGTVWVANSAPGTASSIDIRTNTVGAPLSVGNGPQSIAATRTSVWVANNADGTVSRIEVATGRISSVEATGDGPIDLALHGDGVWVSNEFSGTLTRLDARSGRISQRITTDGQLHGIAVLGGRVWVSVGAAAAQRHRGGTLRVAVGTSFNSIDPAKEYGPMMRMVYDGLVSQQSAGGTPGLIVVPDLATSKPHPTDGGLSYSFTLRRGIRYSDGQEFKPSDVRRGLERAMLGAGASYYSGIVGASSCISSPPPERCDLSGGVVVDDTAFRLTIRLSAPDPEFLAKLSMPYASAAAPGSPMTDTGMSPLPGTGPYQIKGYSGPTGAVTLVRNPYFRQWSQAAQPDGYPDSIVFTPSNEGSARAVERGELEVAPAEDPALLIRRRSQVRVSPGYLSFFMFLNTTTPPFNDVRVRKAINFALDRQALLKLEGDASNQISCHLLPSSFPGHVSDCAYSSTPGGVWSGPDLDRARSLVIASGTAGMHVEVLAPPQLKRSAGFFVPLLKLLGFQAELRVLDDGYFSYLGDPRNNPQMGIFGWSTDYPSASGYLTPVFGCHGEANAARFCDPAVDADMARAARLEGTDPSAASSLWSQIESRVMDASPIVPMYVAGHASFLASHVGNYLDSPLTGPLYDQMWVR